MKNFTLRDANVRPAENEQDPFAAGLLDSLPDIGRKRIEASGRPPELNPLVDPAIRESLSRLKTLEDGLEAEKAAHIENRSPLRAICDSWLNTGKEDLFVKREQAEQEFARIPGERSPREISDSLSRAGLIDIKDHIRTDGASGASIMASYHQIVRVTERGRTLLTVDEQPSVLLAP